MLKGLPASGKSTYAKGVVAHEPNKWKRVNRDSLRKMFAEDFNQKNEKFILQIRDAIISKALENGYNVIIDDLNLSEKHYNRIQSLFGKKAEIVIDDSFLIVPLEELLKRNAGREDKVPEDVIKDLYKSHVTKETKPKSVNTKVEKREYIPYDETKEDCFIFDIDGTLALMNGRNPYDWDSVDTDIPNVPVVNICKMHTANGCNVIIVSGRDAVSRDKTESWLEKNGIDYKHLFMRTKGDHRKDSIVKEEIFYRDIHPYYNVLGVYDDRDQTVEKWRELGLLCMQVAPGSF